MKQYTDITILLDRSGSMESIKTTMEGAYREFIHAHQQVPTTRVTLIQFDSLDNQEVVYQDVPVTHADPLKIKPRGGTPLVDALVTAIDNTGKRLANKDESERPDQVLFVIITDGQENASRQYRKSDVESRVRKQTDGYKWQFVYLGANQDAIAEAQSYGISQDYAIKFMNSMAGTKGAMRGITANTVAYAANTSSQRNNSGTLKVSNTQRTDAMEDDNGWTSSTNSTASTRKSQ